MLERRGPGQVLTQTPHGEAQDALSVILELSLGALEPCHRRPLSHAKSRLVDGHALLGQMGGDRAAGLVVLCGAQWGGDGFGHGGEGECEVIGEPVSSDLSVGGFGGKRWWCKGCKPRAPSFLVTFQNSALTRARTPPHGPHHHLPTHLRKPLRTCEMFYPKARTKLRTF